MMTYNKIALLILFFSVINCSNSNGVGIENDAIECNPTEISAGYAEAQFQVEVKAASEWSAYSEQDWIKCSPSSSIKINETITVTIDKNNFYNDRAGEITLKSGSKRTYITISQMGKPKPTDDENIVTPEGYQLVWHDEFDKGVEPDNKWWYETGGSGWGNNELQHYVSGSYESHQLAAVEDGILTITAKKINDKIYSIRMNSVESWKYGYFEARIKLPSGKGTWPAFWMMPKDFKNWPLDGEIDIMEYVGYDPNVVHSTVHTEAYNHTIGTQKGKSIKIENAETEFHIYAVEWTADFIKGFVDGEEYFRFDNDGNGDKNTWPFNTPFYLKLNLAWGGDWGGAMGVDESILPAEYQIDYVRVFQKK